MSSVTGKTVGGDKAYVRGHVEEIVRLSVEETLTVFWV